VVRIDIDKDVLGWLPPPGMKDDLGQEIEYREYNQADMDRILVLNQRTKLVANRVMQYLNATDPYAKTIIFCEDIDHAERMRVAIVNAAGQIAIDNPKYVMRITGDSVEGKAELDNFIDPESRFPVIATTSELLTTGVDAKTCKLIVLDKTITSMTSFKQIIGRGTRIDEENGKWFFTIMDFKKATELFRDPDFDGEPAVIYEPGDDDDPVPPDPEPGEDDDRDDGIEEEPGVYKVRVSGVDAKIINERIEYIGPDGELMTESYKDFSRIYVKKAATGRGSNGKISPYGIQKLRELILELAVRGKLVPQDPNEETASILLGKMAKEKAQFVKEGKIKKPKKLPVIPNDEIPFGIPKSWEWVRLPDVCRYMPGKTSNTGPLQPGRHRTPCLPGRWQPCSEYETRGRRRYLVPSRAKQITIESRLPDIQ